MDRTPNYNLALPDGTSDEKVIDTLKENFQTIDNVLNDVNTQAIIGVQSKNLFNKDTITRGKYVNSSHGRLSDNTSHFASDYIEIESNTVYIRTQAEQMAFYDVNKVFIFVSGTTSSKTFTTPTNARFIRVSGLLSDLETYQVKKGTEVGEYEKYGGVYVSKGHIEPNLSKQIYNPLYGLKWNALGDSITFGYNGHKPYLNFIKERTGIIPRNYGVSGTTIANKQDGSITNAMCTRYTAMDNDADIITVFGGTNDFGAGRPIGAWNDGTDYTFYGGVQTLIEGLITKYPTKRIGFILPLQRKYVTVPLEHLSVYVGILRECCEYYSIPFLDLYKAGGINPNFEPSRLATMPDGLHPNDAGHEIISHKIEDFIRRI